MGWQPFKVMLYAPSFFDLYFFLHPTVYDVFVKIIQIFSWIFQITYTSDYFPELHELAVELIRRGHAYVDHQVVSLDIL